MSNKLNGVFFKRLDEGKLDENVVKKAEEAERTIAAAVQDKTTEDTELTINVDQFTDEQLDKTANAEVVTATDVLISTDEEGNFEEMRNILEDVEVTATLETIDAAAEKDEVEETTEEVKVEETDVEVENTAEALVEETEEVEPTETLRKKTKKALKILLDSIIEASEIILEGLTEEDE